MTSLSILYVDDDPDIRAIIAMALSLDPAIMLTVAPSGADALALLAGGLRPDVALLDVMMPGMSGPGLLERIQHNPATANVPAIFITAKAREADVAFYAARGAIGVILKPFDPLELAGQIRALIAGHRKRAADDGHDGTGQT